MRISFGRRQHHLPEDLVKRREQEAHKSKANPEEQKDDEEGKTSSSLSQRARVLPLDLRKASGLSPPPIRKHFVTTASAQLLSRREEDPFCGFVAWTVVDDDDTFFFFAIWITIHLNISECYIIIYLFISFIHPSI